jgi:hypothetical protein
MSAHRAQDRFLSYGAFGTSLNFYFDTFSFRELTL